MTEKKRDYMRRYRERNLERIQAYNRNYYWQHRDKMLEYAKTYRDARKASMTEEELEERREYQRTMSRVYYSMKKCDKAACQGV